MGNQKCSVMASHVAQKGEYLELDDWSLGNILHKDFTGFAPFRIWSPRTQYYLAVNVQVTGKPRFAGSVADSPLYKSRCKVIFKGDGEPDTVTRGWIYHEET